MRFKTAIWHEDALKISFLGDYLGVDISNFTVLQGFAKQFSIMNDCPEPRVILTPWVHVTYGGFIHEQAIVATSDMTRGQFAGAMQSKPGFLKLAGDIEVTGLDGGQANTLEEFIQKEMYLDEEQIDADELAHPPTYTPNLFSDTIKNHLS